MVSLTVLLASLALYAPLPVPAPTLVEQPCPVSVDALACTDLSTETISVDPALRDQGSFYFREAIAHEIGHVWEQQHPAAFARYAAMVGPHPSVPELPMIERFADTYAFCAIGPRQRARFKREVGEYYGTYGERIPHRVLASTCWLLRQPSR